MTVLDAYGVIAYLTSEPAAQAVARLLDEDGCVTTATGLAEVIDRMLRVERADIDELIVDLAEVGMFDAVPLLPETAVSAGLLRAKHYHRTRRSVSMADCVLAATAQARDEAVAASDPHLLDLCHDEGIAVVPLPGTDGSTWAAS